MSDLATRVAALTPHQRELLERRLLAKRAGNIHRIPPREAKGPCPLSHTQNLMWMLNQIVGDSPVYNTHFFLRLKGDLDVSALQRALNVILVRHEALRTNFVTINGIVAQVVRDSDRVDLEQRSIETDSEEAQEAEIQRLCLQEACRGFDLAKDPLFRAVLLRVAPGYHVLMVLTNHIVFDGWSRKILDRELKTLYSAFLLGRESPLPPLPIQYADFACWQRHDAQSANAQRQLAHWKQRLAGAPQVLDLPGDRPRPPVQSFRGDRMVSSIASLIDGLQQVASGENATLFMAFMAAFNVVLFRYTGREDILVGTPLLGRLHAELEPLIGYFSNTLVVRTDLSGDPSFRELLARVRAEMLDVFDHQDVPLDLLTAELQPERNPGRNPIFQVMVSLGEDRTEPLGLPGLEVEVIRVDRGVNRLDLTVSASISGDDSSVVVEYPSDLFDAGRTRRMIGHLETLAASVAADPDQPISRLNIIPETERSDLLRYATSRRTEFPRQMLIHELLEGQAAITPDAPAVESESGTITYRELDARANQVAHLLRRRGIGSGARVGLLMERSTEMIAGLLGILKAGAACVPLDVMSPRERLTFFIRDAEVSVVLTQHTHSNDVSEDCAEAICLDSISEDLGRESTDPVEATVTAEGVAYVIYTSGSTGPPKGVLLSHRGLVNHHLFSIRSYGLTSNDRILQSSPITFDIAIEEIFPVLASGGVVVLRPNDLVPGGRHFLDWLDRQRITVLDLPTAFWHQWTWELSGHDAPLPSSLRLVIVGGEKAQARTLAAWRKRTQDRIRWVNTYGPTEASVIATSHELTSSPSDPEADIPIGRPIDNVRVHILDKNFEMVPIGIEGELYIGGEGVALGYLHRPELTAMRFVPDPFAGDASARLFKTGDLARFRSDGEIEFIGRSDHQVKVRGYRVEPGEIESIIQQHSDVAEVVVLNRPNGDTARLVAYVVPKVSASPEAAGLRQFVRDRLPEYMVPAAFVVLSDLPKTTRGKLDREALPMPDSSFFAPDFSFVPPHDELESQIAKIWERVLGVAPIGATDSFFERGGHSLLAVAVFAEVERVFGKTIPLAALFEAQTVRQLADVLRKDGYRPPWSSLVPIQPEGALPPLFCVHAQSGQVLFYRDLARLLGPEQPFYGLQSAGADGSQARLKTVEEMAARYLAEIRTVQPEGPYFLAGFCLGAYVAFEMARQLKIDGDEVAFLGVFDTSGEWRTVDSIGGGVAYHRKRLSTLGGKGKLEYVLRRVGYRLGRVRLHCAHWVSKAFTFAEVAKSERLIELSLHELNARANREYTAESYAGCVDYFHGLGGLPENPTKFWSAVALRGVAIHEVPGAGRELFLEPHVGPLAEALKDSLKNARAAFVSHLAAAAGNSR